MARTPKKPGKTRKKPRWDRGNGRLWWAGRVVRCFQREAPGQMAILDAFQAAGWPLAIDVQSLVPPGRRCKTWIADNVTNLNREIRGIRFHADGRNKHISWGPR